MGRAEEFWSRELAGFEEPTPITVGGTGAGAAGGSGTAAGGGTDRENPEASLVLGEETGDALRRLAREHRITLGTVLQTAWGLLLSRYSGQQEVVFGTTMTHRPTELDGIEETLGLFINTLPLRVRLPSDSPFSEACARTQQLQTKVKAFAASPLASVQQWSDVPRVHRCSKAS